MKALNKCIIHSVIHSFIHSVQAIKTGPLDCIVMKHINTHSARVKKRIHVSEFVPNLLNLDQLKSVFVCYIKFNCLFCVHLSPTHTHEGNTATAFLSERQEITTPPLFATFRSTHGRMYLEERNISMRSEMCWSLLNNRRSITGMCYGEYVLIGAVINSLLVLMHNAHLHTDHRALPSGKVQNTMHTKVS